MVEHDLDEIYNELDSNNQEEQNFWYVRHEEYEPFTSKIAYKDYSKRPLLFLRDINDDEETRIHMNENPEKETFKEAVEQWLEFWKALKNA